MCSSSFFHDSDHEGAVTGGAVFVSGVAVLSIDGSTFTDNVAQARAMGAQGGAVFHNSVYPPSPSYPGNPPPPPPDGKMKASIYTSSFYNNTSIGTTPVANGYDSGSAVYLNLDARDGASLSGCRGSGNAVSTITSLSVKKSDSCAVGWPPGGCLNEAVPRGGKNSASLLVGAVERSDGWERIVHVDDRWAAVGIGNPMTGSYSNGNSPRAACWMPMLPPYGWHGSCAKGIMAAPYDPRQPSECSFGCSTAVVGLHPMHQAQETLRCSPSETHNFVIWNGTCGCRKGEYDGAPGEFDGLASGAGLCLPCPAHSTTVGFVPATISSCKCESGWVGNIQSSGDECVADPCLANPCDHGGACKHTKQAPWFTCDCAGGMWGPKCDMVDRCNASETGIVECKHGGRCTRMDTAAGFDCSCKQNYTGVHCEIEPPTPGHPHPRPHSTPPPPPVPAQKIDPVWLALLLAAGMAVGCCVTRLMSSRPRWCCPHGCLGLLPPTRKHEDAADSRELREALTAAPTVLEPEPEEQPTAVDPTLYIQVGSLSGKQVQLAVQPLDSVERVKRMVYLEAGVPPMEQRLLLNGDELADDSTMEQAAVVNGSTIHLVLRLMESASSGAQPKKQDSQETPLALAPPAPTAATGSPGLDSSVPAEYAPDTETKGRYE